jgi:hypothetical protein
LINSRARADYKDRDGHTPLDVIKYSHCVVAELLKQAMQPWHTTHHHLAPRKTREQIAIVMKMTVKHTISKTTKRFSIDYL